MKRAVLDTNILLSAVGWEGNERALVRAGISGRFEIAISEPLIREFKRMALHPKFDFSEEEADYFIDSLLAASLVFDPAQALAVCRDPEDNRVLECALEAHADFIVTGDKDLLSLREFRGIRIVTAK